MDKKLRTRIIDIINAREATRPLPRVKRLLQSPWRTLPYYGLATLGHLRPFRLTFRTLWNTRMTCYLPEGNTFFYYGYAEANLTNFFLRYVRPGMTCFDIGAHVGFYSMLFSVLTGPGGSVHSFEPTPWTFSLLHRNTNDLKNVRTNNLAVTEGATVIELADYGPGYGAYNTAHENGAPALTRISKPIVVAGTSLDSYCNKHLITPDIIKIDAEGFEHSILLGMKSLFNKRVIRPLITLEVAGAEVWKQNREESFTLLNQNEYQAFSIKSDGLITAHERQNDYVYDNLLFMPKERLSELQPFLIDRVI